MDPDAVYLEHLEMIGRTALAVCRRNGVDLDEAEDFASDVRLKLCEDNYAIIRKFGGRSSMATYLGVVIANLFRDFRIHKWGKWRPSTQARRLGETAIRLETLMFRDGCTFDSACQVLTRQLGQTVDTSALRRLLTQLPRRAPRRIDGGDDPTTLPANERADGPTLDAERDAQLAVAKQGLEHALGRFPAEDRVILRLHFYEGMTVAEVARGLCIEQKPLYARIRHLLQSIKQSMRSDGISAELDDILPIE